jgi:hypothetical protein
MRGNRIDQEPTGVTADRVRDYLIPILMTVCLGSIATVQVVKDPHWSGGYAIAVVLAGCAGAADPPDAARATLASEYRRYGRYQERCPCPALWLTLQKRSASL